MYLLKRCEVSRFTAYTCVIINTLFLQSYVPHYGRPKQDIANGLSNMDY